MENTKAKRVSLGSIFWAYFLVGLTAFGFAILQKLKSLVRDKNWLSETELNEGIALVQLYPGPIMVNLNTYVGYRLRGLPGALASTVAFITPTTILMIVLSYFYFFLGKMPWVKPVFTGLDALVVGILINIVLDFGKRGIKGKITSVIAVIAFAVLVLNLNVVYLVLFALGAGALLIRPEKDMGNVVGKGKQSKSKSQETGNFTERTGIDKTNEGLNKPWWKRWLGIGLGLLVLLAGVGLALKLSSNVGKAALSFFKIGSIAFGNGLTILPLIQADVVSKYHWLTLRQFTDGIALSQLTPGPFLVIATFIGFKLGGVWAALLTTFAIFAPSFIITLIFTEVFSRVKNITVVKGALAGVLAAFVGLLAAMVLQIGAIFAHNPVALIFSASAFAAVRFFKLDILIIFAGGLALWIGLYAVGISL